MTSHRDYLTPDFFGNDPKTRPFLRRCIKRIGGRNTRQWAVWYRENNGLEKCAGTFPDRIQAREYIQRLQGH